MFPALSMVVGEIFMLNMVLLLGYMLPVADDTEGRNPAEGIFFPFH